MVAFVQAAVPSPGPITSVHIREAELTGVFGCVGCHAGPREEMATACLACHADIKAQLEPGAVGFHANIKTVPATACSTCHQEHRSRDASLVDDHSFAAAGYGERRGYRHDGLGFGLEGRHLQLGCEKCHELALVDQLKKDQKRFLGQHQVCAGCHDDPHKSKLDDCAACHGQEGRFELAPKFKHNESFPLVGGHKGLPCKRCHAADSAHAFEKLVQESKAYGFDAKTMRLCSACHKASHRADFLSAVAGQLGLRGDDTCGQCHDCRNEGFGGTAAKMTAELHALAGFSLDKPHQSVECKKCHPKFGDIAAIESDEARLEAFAATYPGRQQDTCSTCHANLHEGQFKNGAFQRAVCLDCHDRQAFRPAAFSARDHEKTRFPLQGKHLKVECDGCHQRPAGADETVSRIFTGTATRCEQCHEHPHAGQFEVGPFAGRDCLVCHDLDGFRPARFSLEQHDKSKFPLTGAHRAVACRSCHKPIDGNESKRRLSGTPTVCTECHTDVHKGAFDRRGLPKTVEGRTGCARCHAGADAFRPVEARLFDHDVWTQFKLVGKHREAGCEKCHGDSGRLDKPRPVLEPDTDCASCHTDVHAGQFEQRGRVDCGRCHQDDKTFKDVVFDHQKDTRFKLDASHENLACSKCHRAVALPNGESIVRYKPLPVDCKDCHTAGVPKPKSAVPSREFTRGSNR